MCLKAREITKGLLISKCLCGIFNFSKKWTKNLTLLLWYLKSNCFCSFLEEFKTLKNTFRNQLTFRRNQHQKKCQFMSCLMIAWNFISLDTKFQQKPPASEIKVVIKMFKPRQIGQHRARHKIHDSFHLHLFVGTLFFICLCIILGFKCLGMWSRRL